MKMKRIKKKIINESHKQIMKTVKCFSDGV